MRLIALLLIPLLLAACGNNAADVAPEPVRPALVQKVAPASGSLLNVFSGEIRARHETELAFRIAGKITAREVEVGTAVKPGTVLARLDTVDVGLQVNQTEAQRALAEAEVKRYRDLRAKNFISQSALDARETTFRAAEAQSGLARNQSAYAVLRADHAGVVTAVNAEPGQVVAAGQTVVRLARPEEPEVVINVPENRLKEFRAAKKIVVALWSAPGKRYQGRVRELAPVADAATRTFTARVSVLDADADVQLGMTANVMLDNAAGQEVFALPLSALTRIDGKPAVWVFDPVAQTVSPRAVTVSNYGSEDHVGIVGGLKAGEMVVTAGVHKLLAGQKVRPVTATTDSL